MMREIQATEAKAHLAQLLRDVEHGETIVLTRHGKPIAHLVPVGDQEGRARANSIRKFVEKRDRLPRVQASDREILSWRHEGHRF